MTDSLTTVFHVTHALRICMAAHAEQVDKGGAPYAQHPIRVALDTPGGPTYKCAALLHDIVEDTDVTLSELFATFPCEVVDAVDALTRRKDDGETFFDYIRRCKQNPIARIVKLADIRDNSDTRRVAHDAAALKTVKGLIKSRYKKAEAILVSDGINY